MVLKNIKMSLYTDRILAEINYLERELTETTMSDQMFKLKLIEMFLLTKKLLNPNYQELVLVSNIYEKQIA